jgi:hypothetical protein
VLDGLFDQDDAPQWVLLWDKRNLTFIDRAKWGDRRSLEFGLEDLLDGSNKKELEIFNALLHRQNLCPEGATSLLETLEDNSRRKAVEVSESLKDAIRESVEALGNEYVYSLRQQNKRVYEDDPVEQASRLTLECVRYMYRLLFCFYLEARPDLKFLPIAADSYAQGYSLELLRDLEQMPLETEEQENGTFFHESLTRLFTLIWEGRQIRQSEKSVLNVDFEIPPLRSHLFDPAEMPLLSKVKFRNKVIQKVIRSLSLGRTGSGKSKRLGRVSYATLSLAHLGAVYENLLAYSGFFAKERLYEVKPADEDYDPTIHSYFVKEKDFANYLEKEKVQVNGHYLVHEPGDYVYRLAGRDRDSSASYYTPESLAHLTVEWALKDLIADKTADEILDIRICEMAVGSANILNEAISQVANAYLKKKQEEVGRRIEPSQLSKELQKVRMYIADRHISAVDLNSTAVELAELSLWLNSMYEGAFVPWFGMQVMHGNSLVGARREYWNRSEIYSSAKGKKNNPLAQRSAPHPFDWKLNQRPEGSVYHWLLPDEKMANYKDKVLKQLRPQELKTLATKRKEFCAPLNDSEASYLSLLSDSADVLWEQLLRELAQLNALTTDDLTVWPEEAPQHPHLTTTAEKDVKLQQLILQPASAYSRLKLAMDYWCALWFWPVDEAELFPSRADFMMDMSLILGLHSSAPAILTQGTFDLGATPQLTQGDLPLEQASLSFDEVNTEDLIRDNERLAVASRLSSQLAFFHWEVAFAPVFHEKGGFDLIAGNPPWVRLEWNEAGLLSEYDPHLALHKLTAPEVASQRPQVFNDNPGLQAIYEEELTHVIGQQNFLNSANLYPLTVGSSVNLYRNFITRSWDIINDHGYVGFVHPENVYDSSQEGFLRRSLYRRLSAHFQFQNELGLFDIHHEQKFSTNVYGPIKDDSDVRFVNMSNLFTVNCVDESIQLKNVSIPVEGIKNDQGKWSTKGHPQRVVTIGNEELSTFARLFSEEETPVLEAPLPHIHAQHVMTLLEKIAHWPRSVDSLGNLELFSTTCWNETTSCKEGTIKRDTHFAEQPEELILNGPLFYVANPCYKTARNVCTKNSDFDVLDLEKLPDDYLPRVNYSRACDLEEYRRRAPKLPWDTSKNFLDSYKLSFREMLSVPTERTLFAALTCAGTAHVNAVLSLTTQNCMDMLAIASMSLSLVGDFYIKLTGASHLHERWMSFPLLPPHSPMIVRVLALNCLTKWYDSLWKEAWRDDYCNQRWYGNDPRLPKDFWRQLSPEWSRDCALRNAFARRWALCELDVLVARELGMTLDELCDAYRLQFPVLRQNEDDTWYDANGRIIFTRSMGLSGVGLDRKEFEAVKGYSAGMTVEKTWIDTTLPTGPVERHLTYVAPFTKQDREQDYATIWAALDEEGKN